jgi:hypothetical protein
MEAWMGAWNGYVHSFTSDWRELRTVVETLKMEEVVFNKLRGRSVFYFMDNEVTYNICKKVSSKTLSLHMLVPQLKALELALRCHLEVIHVPGTTTITQGTDGVSRGIWANGINIDFKSFAVGVFLPAFPSLSLTKWSLSHIGIYEDYAPLWNVDTYAPLWNVEMDTSSWEPRNLMQTNTFWVL